MGRVSHQGQRSPEQERRNDQAPAPAQLARRPTGGHPSREQRHAGRPERLPAQVVRHEGAGNAKVRLENLGRCRQEDRQLAGIQRQQHAGAHQGGCHRHTQDAPSSAAGQTQQRRAGSRQHREDGHVVQPSHRMGGEEPRIKRLGDRQQVDREHRSRQRCCQHRGCWPA